jgi:hypothetical protein
METIPTLSEKLNYIQGKGKHISIWDDHIMGKRPLSLQLELDPLKTWMAEHGLNYLHEISSWNNRSRIWSNWKSFSFSMCLCFIYIIV